MDFFNKNTHDLKKKRLFLFDMDGTIYRGDKVFDGTCSILDYIHDIGGKYVFVTNNSSKSVEDYIMKIDRLGIKAEKDNFFTSTQATVLYLEQYYPGRKVYCQGTQSFVTELKNNGIDVTERVENVDVVLVGFDTELTSAKLSNTCEILSTQSCSFIATNPDLRCPVNFGFIPDCGSICKMIEETTGKRPIYIGKPEARMINLVRQKFGYSVNQTIVIGDRLYTDIAAGLNAGVCTACVLTGEAEKEDILTASIKPTYTFENIMKLYEDLCE